jgi:hypothetical protein
VNVLNTLPSLETAHKVVFKAVPTTWTPNTDKAADRKGNYCSDTVHAVVLWSFHWISRTTWHKPACGSPWTSPRTARCHEDDIELEHRPNEHNTGTETLNHLRQNQTTSEGAGDPTQRVRPQAPCNNTSRTCHDGSGNVSLIRDTLPWIHVSLQGATRPSQCRGQ